MSSQSLSTFNARTRFHPYISPIFLPLPPPTPAEGMRKKSRHFFSPPFSLFQRGWGSARPVFLSSLPCALYSRFSSKVWASLSRPSVLHMSLPVATLRRSHLEILEVPISVSLFRRAGRPCSARCSCVWLSLSGVYFRVYS